jgi:hypothetical protein
MKTFLPLIALAVCSAINASASDSGYTDHYTEHCRGEGGSMTTLEKDCLPDTLYSWQWRNELDFSILDSTPFIIWDKALYRGDPRAVTHTDRIYAWRTPLGTAGYGDTQIRIKLKPDVQFEVVQWNDRYCSDSRPKNTVLISYSKDSQGQLTDFIVCSIEAVDSWSIHASGAYEEAQREMSFITQQEGERIQRYDSYAMPRDRIRLASGVQYQNPWFPTIRDENAIWLKTHFIRNLTRLKSGGGRIYGNAAAHFKSNVRSYFNP